jgi:hypothetical protein
VHDEDLLPGLAKVVKSQCPGISYFIHVYDFLYRQVSGFSAIFYPMLIVNATQINENARFAGHLI